MRRIAPIALAAFVLLVSSALGQQHSSIGLPTSIVQVQNRTTHDLTVVADLEGFTIHRKLFPHDFLVLKDVREKSCVRIHLANERENFDHCRPAPGRVDLACNLPDKFICLVHHGADKDLVVTVEQLRQSLRR